MGIKDNIRKIWEKAGSPAIINPTVGKIVDLANKVYNIKDRNFLIGILDLVQVRDNYIKARKKEAELFVQHSVSKEKQIQVCDMLLSVSTEERLSAVALFQGWINRAGEEQPGH